MQEYHVIGLMSGSSLDGIDLAYCTFKGEGRKWDFKVNIAETIPYPTKWKLRLGNLTLQNAINYIKTHTFYGHYLGMVVLDFVKTHGIEGKVDFIASHGQTIFHQPENHLTSQIGDGAAIASECNIPVICDFRTMDIAIGGQGTPIAPIGDLILFDEYSHCLNLGGISNISYKIGNDEIIGFDICAVNLMLNHLAEEMSLDYDKNGNLARAGELNQELLKELNQSWYFTKAYPKSLSGGWVNKVILPPLKRSNLSTQDKLRTAVEHIALQIKASIEDIYKIEEKSLQATDKMLVTGGGGLNQFLMERIAALSPIPIELPSQEIIEFKEAIIMGLMGVLRINNETNCISKVTGAKHNTIGGVIFQTNLN